MSQYQSRLSSFISRTNQNENFRNEKQNKFSNSLCNSKHTSVLIVKLIRFLKNIQYTDIYEQSNKDQKIKLAPHQFLKCGTSITTLLQC